MSKELYSLNDGGNTLLTKAIEDHEAPSTVEAIIKAGADVNFPNSQGKTPLMMAAEARRSDLLKILFEYGADPELKTPRYSFTISLCLKRDFYSYLEILMKQNIYSVHSVIENLKEICLCLRDTGKHKDKNTSDFLCQDLNVDPRLISVIKSVYDVNLVEMNENTPLMHAVRCHLDDCVRLLLLAGADVNKINKNKETALTIAMTRSHNPILKDLIRAGALQGHPRDETSTLNFEMFKMILDYLKQNRLLISRDIFGKTALMYAAEQGDMSCIMYAVELEIEEFLKAEIPLDSKEISRCVDDGSNAESISYPSAVMEPNIRCEKRNKNNYEDNRREDSTVIYAIRYCHFLNEKITKLLVGDTHKEQYQDGRTALMNAVSFYNGDFQMYIEPLIGDSCSIQDKHGKTALMYALSNKLIPDDLLEKMVGDSQNLQDKDGKTALMLSFILKRQLSEEMIELLAGETPFIQDNAGKTALMYAFECKQFLRYSCIQKLVGGQVDIRDNEGNTTLIYALKYELRLSEEIVSLLVGDNTEKYQNGKTALMIGLELNNTNLKTDQYLRKDLFRHSFYRDNYSTGTSREEHFSNLSGEISRLYRSQYLAGHYLKPLLGGPCSIQDNDGKTALMYACMYTPSISENILEQMIGDSQNIQDNVGKTALMYALMRPNTISENILQLMIGDSQNLHDNDGKTALMYALINTHGISENILQMVIGDSQNLQDNDGKTALMYAFIKTEGPSENRMQIIISAHKNIQDKDEKKLDKIHNFIQSLVDCSCNFQDKSGGTALMYAMRHNRLLPENMFNQMIRESQFIQDNEGKTALMHASLGSLFSNYFIIKLFHKDALNMKDNEGKTALHHAIEHGHSNSFIGQLLLHGANIEVKDKQNRTALDLCLEFDTRGKTSRHLETQTRNRDPANIRGETFSKTKMLLRFIPDPRHGQLGKESILMSFEKGIFNLKNLHENKEIFRLMIVNGIETFPHLHENMSLFFAILKENLLDVVKYLIANMYLKSQDLMLLIKARNYLQSDEYFKNNKMPLNGTYLDLSSPDLQHLITEVTSQPWPLVKLSFVVVSSAVGHGTNREDRVNRLPLPNPIKDSLMFNTRTALIPVSEWSNIPMVFDPVEYEKTRRPRPLLNYWPCGAEL